MAMWSFNNSTIAYYNNINYMAIKIYKRTIDLVSAIRSDGGVPNEEKYKKGNNKYINIINYIKKEYSASHRQAMDAAKYFMY